MASILSRPQCVNEGNVSGCILQYLLEIHPPCHFLHSLPLDFSPIHNKQFKTLIFTRGQFWPPGIVVACVRPSVRHQVCPRDNSSPVEARITKFRPKMQNTVVKVLLVLGGNQPSRPNLRSKSKFTPFWACPHHNSSPIQARITKFGPEVQNTLVKIPIVLGGNWPWPSRSDWTPKSKFTPFWACPCHNSPPIRWPDNGLKLLWKLGEL